MGNLGPDVIGEVLGGYDLVPPPTVGLKFKPKKLLKKAGRGLKKAGKLAVKVHTAPLKFAAKTVAKAGKAVARLAARPIRAQFRKLGMRRARMLSWQRRKSLQPNTGEKAEASKWTVQKMRGNPAGRLGVFILTHTWGTTVSGQIVTYAAMGMTGAEIATAAAAIIGTIAGLMASLNKPGQAPADPRAGDREEGTDDGESSDNASESGILTTGWNMKRAGWGMPHRYVTLAEANAMVDKLATMKKWGAPMFANRDDAEKEFVNRMYKRGIGIVADMTTMPEAEKAARQAAGMANMLGLGAEKGKKAYRKSPKPSGPMPENPSAEEMLEKASRYGGYRSRKEQIKAAKRGEFLMGATEICGTGCCDSGCNCRVC